MNKPSGLCVNVLICYSSPVFLPGLLPGEEPPGLPLLWEQLLLQGTCPFHIPCCLLVPAILAEAPVCSQEECSLTYVHKVEMQMHHKDIVLFSLEGTGQHPGIPPSLFPL